MFTEDWYSTDQIHHLCAAALDAVNVPGMFIEVGCWEGRSTIAIARKISPRRIYAVDTWAGSVDESPNHATVEIIRTRNVYQRFMDNINEMNVKNIIVRKSDWRNFFDGIHPKDKIAFLHIDGSHDYKSVKDNILAAIPLMADNGIICGDDFLTSNSSRLDLGGGVERAVRDTLPGFVQIGNFWRWRKH